ncbi:MAG: CHAD domain-containing protein [Rhodocyclales bacterium]|nr:CHAD domain-containing protein [Rhodocyclales bacterium]
MAEEVELKLALDEAHQARFLRHPLLRQASERQVTLLDNIYYDTAGLALRRRGIALRLRRQGNAWLQTVKLAGSATAGLSSRPEWERPYGGHFDFSDIEPTALRNWLQRPELLARILPVCETRFRRVTWKLRAQTGAVLVTLDRGWAIADGKREAISEVELELDGAPVQALFHIAGQLAERISLVPAVLSKAERGYRLHSGTMPTPVKAESIALSSSMGPFDAFCRIALSCLEHLQQNHHGALRTEDVEYIHQMRVATRRLRAALRLFAPALPQELRDGLRQPMATLTRQLGQARDLDVLLGEIVDPVQNAMPEEPRLAALASNITELRYGVRAEVLAALAAPTYGRMLLGAVEALHPLTPPRLTTASLGEFAAARLRHLCRRLRRLATAASTSDPASLHLLRIGIKRLRYALEFFATPATDRTLHRLQSRLAVAQDTLGRLNDLANAGVRLSDCAGNDPGLREAVALIGGWHGARHARLLVEIADALPKLARMRLPRRLVDARGTAGRPPAP